MYWISVLSCTDVDVDVDAAAADVAVVDDDDGDAVWFAVPLLSAVVLLPVADDDVILLQQ